MKFDYDSETNEYVCPKCDSRYDKYNSLFKHYQRNHSQEANNEDKTVTVIDSSRDKIVTAMNKDDNVENDDIQSLMSIEKNDDKTVTNDDKIYTSTDKINDISIDKKGAKIAFNLVLVIVGIAFLSILYKKGFFDPLLNKMKLPAQNYQRSIFS